MAAIVVGLDGGGTKTACVVADGTGRVLGTALAGPSNLQNEGPEGSGRAIGAALRAALRAAGGKAPDVAAFCLGLGGLDTPRDQETYQKILAGLIPRRTRLRIENDVFIALSSGTWGAPGVAVVAGTGSIAGGIGPDGRRMRVGGWGYLVSDEGSAFAAGREAVAAAIAASEGTGLHTAVLDLVLRRFSASGIAEVVQATYTHPKPQTLLASLAPLLDAVASTDDVAAGILRRSGAHLARLAVAVVRRLELTSPVPVVVVGGMFSAPLVLEEFTETLRREVPGAQIIRPECEPVAGAVALALQDAGAALTPVVIGRLRQIHISRTASGSKAKEVKRHSRSTNPKEGRR